jgi:hypothetical protein
VSPSSAAARSGSDDVGEEDRGELSVGVARSARAGEKFLDLVHERVRVLGEPEVVGSVELHVLGGGDVFREIPAELGRRDPILSPVDHEGRGPDDR